MHYEQIASPITFPLPTGFTQYAGNIFDKNNYTILRLSLQRIRAAMQRVDHVSPVYYIFQNYRAPLHLPTCPYLNTVTNTQLTYPNLSVTISDVTFPAADQMK